MTPAARRPRISIVQAGLHVGETVEIPGWLAENDPHPPLYYLTLHGWTGLTGESELATRTLSALLGILAIPLIGLLGRWMFGPVAAGVVMAIVALNPLQIAQARDARMYPLLVVLTVGATANQNGTALYEGITVLFLAQLAGIELTLAQQLMVVYLAILGGIGTAGVPAGSIPFVIAILASVGIDPALIAVVLGVDRILDMCRTTLNVSGDLAAAAYVARSEGYAIGMPRPAPVPE